MLVWEPSQNEDLAQGDATWHSIAIILCHGSDQQAGTLLLHEQDKERLEGDEELPNTKPMMEMQAGSNVWYQAYVLKESINEAKVRFPRE